MDRITDHFKKGYKTSEFWVTLATGVVLLINAATGLDLDTDSLVALVGTNASYVIGRSWLKTNRVKVLPYE
jgi:hypothetical protein